jgi:hypothetical protein
MVGEHREARADDLKADLREAYERGRRDERATRKRHPILMTFTFVAAAVGLALLALAAFNGSFSGAGQVVDKNLTVAADRAEPAVRDAASSAGQTLREAGRSADSATTTTADAAS